ncbi:MAG: GNAT family N-acetyltransferase [Rhodanobacteraceae bacterium]
MPQARTAARIRPATLADLDALLALEEAIFDSDRISRAQWRRHIGSTSATVLVSGDPHVIDAAVVVFYRRGASNARLYSLAVGAHARGSGMGGALLAAAEADARAHGSTAMRLEVRVDNPAAIALYERRGYTRIAHLPHFYEDGADAWRYAKPLTPVMP